MPVLNKEHHRKLFKELDLRFATLINSFTGRELKSNSEGCKGRYHWQEPKDKRATIGDSSDIRLAVDDFKNILAEIRKLK